MSKEGFRLGRSPESALCRSRLDLGAFAEFYDLHFVRVVGFFRRRVGDADIAFDLTSEAFARALELRAQFRGSTALEEQAWLFSIARSLLLRYWRDGSFEAAALVRLGIARPALLDADIDRIEELASLPDAAEVRRALESLPDDQREAIELRVLGEAEYDAVATRLGISSETARSRVSRGLRTLAHSLAPFR